MPYFNALLMRIKEHFKDNEVSLEKLEYIEEKLKLNLSIYKKLNKNNENSSDTHYKPLFKNQIKKNLIIGALSNYNWEIVEPFFVSFKRVGFENCDFVMFVNNIDIETKKKIRNFWCNYS